MNMISTGAFLNEMDASDKQDKLVTKLVSAWEKKNSKAARAGGVSLMALSLAACGSSDETAEVEMSQIAYDAAIANATTSNDATISAAAKVTALTGSDNTVHSTVDAAVTSNDAAITTAALTHTDKTIYASVDAAKTAGSLMSSGDAVTAALTGSDSTIHASVDAAVTSNDVAIAAAATTAANAAAEATLVAGTGFSTVAALNTAYVAAIAATPANNATLTTGTENVFGTANNDTITATLATFTVGDIITDGTSTDSDTINVTTTDDISATPVVSGIENVNFTLTSVAGGATGTATFTVDAANINAATITGAATHSSTVVTTFDVDNVKTGVTVNSALATMNVATVANADVTVGSTAATATIIQSGTADTLTISGGNLTVNSTTADEAITITATGTVSMTEGAASAAGTDIAFNITSGGNMDLVDINDTGTLTATANAGNIIVGATDMDIDGAMTLTTVAGDITVTNADDAAAALTITAVGAGPADTTTAADGAIIVTSADAATSAVLTSTDSITITSLDSATTATLSAAANSTIDNVDVLGTVTLKSTSTAATPIIYDFATDTNEQLETITIAGSNDVTVAFNATDLVIAAGNNQALVATDTSTGTSRLVVEGDAAGAALDLSGIALDEVEIAFDQGTNSLTLKDDGKYVVSANQTDLTVTAAAVAGNTVNIVLDSGTVGTGVTLTDLSSTNVGTFNITMADDSTASHVITNAGIVATTDVTISGNGALTIGALATAQVAKTINASGVTGAITANVVMAGAFTTGSGNDTINISDAVSTTRIIDGGAGSDTLVFAASDNFASASLTLSNIETLNVAASTITLAGAQVTGKGYSIVGDAASDSLALSSTVATGESIDIGASEITLATVTITGGNGADAITGSATQATTMLGGAGSDTIIGGAGADIVSFIMHATDTDTITLGGGSDIVQSTTATAGTVAAVTIKDFNAGTASTNVDQLKLSDAALQGLTTTTDMTDTSSVAASTGLSGAVVHVTTDGGTITAADLVVLKNGYATDALALAGIKTAGADTITYAAALTDNDSYLIAYQDGADTNIAVATTTATGGTSEGVDTLATIVILEGVDASNLNTNDFIYIA